MHRRTVAITEALTFFMIYVTTFFFFFNVFFKFVCFLRYCTESSTWSFTNLCQLQVFSLIIILQKALFSYCRYIFVGDEAACLQLLTLAATAAALQDSLTAAAAGSPSSQLARGFRSWQRHLTCRGLEAREHESCVALLLYKGAFLQRLDVSLL